MRVSNSGGRSRFPAARYLVSLIVVLVLGCAAPGWSYLWEEDTLKTGSWWVVSGLKITEIGMPGSVRIQWDYTNHSYVTPTFDVRRRGGAGDTVFTTTTNHYLVDTSLTTSPTAWGVASFYDVRVRFDALTMGLPAPPPGANPDDIYHGQIQDLSSDPWTTGTYVTIKVVPVKVGVYQNQAVDSRLDLRYATNVFKDFQFGADTYRGGLFAGYAADPSKVGRSLVKFQMAPLPNNNYFWTGSLNLYHTRNAATSTATVGIHAVSDSWTDSTVKWSTAPTLTPASPLASLAIPWNSASPVEGWKTWLLGDPVGLPLMTDGVGSFGIAVTNEANTAWAYFAKTQFDSTHQPTVTYAYGGPIGVLELLGPTSILDTGTGTGTAILNGPSSVGQVVNLSSSNSAMASVPATVTVPAGSPPQVNFTITGHTVATATNVTITATINGDSDGFVVTVLP